MADIQLSSLGVLLLSLAESELNHPLSSLAVLFPSLVEKLSLLLSSWAFLVLSLMSGSGLPSEIPD